MSIIADTTSENITQTGGNPDIGSGGTTTTNGIITIIPGNFMGSYEYDILSIFDVDGHAYYAGQGSNIESHSSVAAFNRNKGFSVNYTSTGNFVCCAAHAGQAGFLSNIGSSVVVRSSVAAINTTNYTSQNESVLHVLYSASVFPVLYGAVAARNSAVYLDEYETMTYYWSTNGVVPVHFASLDNSSIRNYSGSLTSKTSAGFSGPVMNNQSLSFIWSHINKSYPRLSSGGSISAPTTNCSYRYVPFHHSVDYGNVVGGASTINDSTPMSTSGLLAVISQERVNYASVKAPAYLFQPEDGSGIIGQGGITGPYSTAFLLIPT